MHSNKKFEILSAQKWKEYYAIQVVYEWEDILSSVLNIPLDTDSLAAIDARYLKRVNQFFHKIVRKTFLRNFIDISYNYLKRKKKNTYFINYQLYVINMPNHFIYEPNSIPIFIDCFRNMVDLIPVFCKKNPLVFVTDFEIFKHLQNSTIKEKIRFVPLSISDKYYRQAVPEKKIDVLQMGRQNAQLHQWMIKVTEKFPHIEYVFAEKKDEVHRYFSTTRGWIDERTDTREEFMNFLSSARISLLSSPGVDDTLSGRTGGYNPVTPRFYESAINYCYLIGRYPDTPDFIYNNVASICERPTDYGSFEKLVLNMLAKPFDLQEKYKPFIQQHLTSETAKLIQAEIEKI